MTARASHGGWLLLFLSLRTNVYICGMKTLYVTDMDGTLLGSDSRVSRHSAEIISSLTQAGALITVATARTPATVVPLLSQCRMSLPAIVMTGAAMWDWETSRYVNSRYISLETAQQIEQMGLRYGINMFQYTLGTDGVLDVFHDGKMSEKELAFVAERSDLKYKRFHLDCEYRNDRDTALFFAMGERQRIFALADELRAGVDCSVSAYVDIFGEDTGILELFAPAVSKAASVKLLAQEVGASRVVVFGDNLNDIPMMRVADVPVAVGNALEEVKKVAACVIDANNTDAVARYIRDDFYKFP